MKKAISILLILTALMGIALSGGVSAAPVKDGYTLVPAKYGKMGVDISSSFILTVPNDASVEDIIASLSIDGQPAPDITKSGEKEFTIAPTMELTPNSLYVFRLQREGEPDITWAFQTAKKFQVMSNYPYNTATNVPRNSGIEITFSDEGYTPIDDYFSISPQVEGRFEYHKNTAVFVPGRLEYRTVYTVTIKAGLKLEGTNEQLLADHVFAFETEAEPDYKPPVSSSYEDIYFYSKYTELPTIEAPTVGFRISYSYSSPMPDPKINVYKFNDNAKAVEAVSKILQAPSWSRYANEENLAKTSGLSTVMSFQAKDYYDDKANSISLPAKLSQGFYLIDAVLGNSNDQMIVQINDLPVQVIADNDQTLVWVNDISTGKASSYAIVRDVKDGLTYRTDANGVAVIGRPLATDGSEQLTITSTNGKICVWMYTPSYSLYYDYYYYEDYYGDYYGGYGYYNANGSEAYWTALQLDRTLFKRDDTVSFFGFVKERKNNEEIKNVTAVLTQGYSYGRYGYGHSGTRDELHRQAVPVQNGAYSDEIKLPNLDSGSYCLTVYHGETVLGSTYFNVEEYVKPPYKIEVSADKKAVLAGDTVTFTAKAGFFEGTPVSGLDVSYDLYSYGLTTTRSSQGKTDIDGNIIVSQRIIPKENTQGQVPLSFSTEATLPEVGVTINYAHVRAFINDIEVRAEASRNKANATLTVNVNSITLDRINNGTAEHYYDYLDKPVASKSISTEIYRVYYVKQEAGSYYSFIEKKNIPIYTYHRNEEVIDRFTIATDSAGKATRQFTVPDRDHDSYFARVECIDGNGRTITQNIYIGRDYSQYYQYASMDEYYLDGAKDSYDIGEDVTLTVRRGTDAVMRGNFLFVAMQRGIQSHQAGMNPYNIKFEQQNVPNITVYAYYFDGYKYHSGYYMTESICFDYSKNDLTLTASADKQSYKPGDMCSITITAKDKNGNAKGANINISVVDEALFALRDYQVNTLISLYRTLSPGLRFATATHRTYERDDLMDEEADSPSAAPEPGNDAGAKGEGGDTYLREVFKDTAIFDTITTNERGEAVYTFKLPDNITSWRLTMSGISSDLYAGNAVKNIIVTNPMFLNYTLNDEFLIGDMPTVGVNAYGTSLTGGELVSFEVWDENAPDTKYTATGAAFERVNIPLWKMQNEGANALVIKATVNNGTSDAVRHQYQVLKTYREIDEAVYYDVKAGTVFDVGAGGLTNITFTDRSRGQFLYQLLSMRRVYGDRLERLMVRREANRILTEYFPDVVKYWDSGEFDLRPYQRYNGGMAILPHADSDPETTVKVLPYIKDDVDINALKNYLYGIYEGENAENKMCALYGLAMLHEPVLLDLNNYSLLDWLSVKDAVYIALGYEALGDSGTASQLYDSRVAPRLERVTPYYRVNTGVDNDDILEATAAASLLATKLNKPEKDGLYQYCIKNYTTDILINIERLSHIEHEIAKRTEESGSITYTLFGERYTRELKNGGCYTLRVPAQNISSFELIEVTGDVGAVSTYKKPMDEVGKTDDDITVKRRYYKANGPEISTETFEQGDLVRVQIWIDYTAKAIDGSYCVTDYLPAGLEYVSRSAKIGGTSDFGYGYFRYCTVEGQKVTFYDYNGRFNRGYLYYYYARVISPGTYRAEGPFVQNLTAKDYYTVGEDATLVIR